MSVSGAVGAVPVVEPAGATTVGAVVEPAGFLLVPPLSSAAGRFLTEALTFWNNKTLKDHDYRTYLGAFSS